jgi:hypothetical protein
MRAKIQIAQIAVTVLTQSAYSAKGIVNDAVGAF